MTSIVENMGIERLRARAPEWLRMMLEARKLTPTCTGTAARTGERCRNGRLRGSDKCRHHLKGEERDTIDEKRYAAAARKLHRTTNARFRAEAEGTIRVIERRRLHRSWKTDPRIPGSTLTVSAGDEKRIHKWLRDHHGIDLDQAETGERYRTPRCLDRLRWAAVLAIGKRMDAETARRRVVVALKDDKAFWDRLEAAEVAAT